MAAVTDPNDPGLNQTRPDGQNENYLVLSEEERAKGFVRPVRTKYKHIGRSVCGKIRPTGRLGGTMDVCCQEVGHEGEHWYVFQPLSQPEAARADQQHVIGGCGSVTTMGQALAETYASNPTFYGATFCCNCGSHLPVGPNGEFVWEPDGERVGS